MAAYSAVAVFRHTLEQLLDSDQFPPHVSKSQITSLHENVCSLQSYLEKFPLVPKPKRDKMKDLQSRIREAIYAAQDEVDYWVRGHSPQKSDEKTMKKLEADIQLVERDAALMEQETRDAEDVLAEDPVLESDSFNLSGEDKIVGQEEDLVKVLDRLKNNERRLGVISITGLPGIGKTTLARSIYDHKNIRESFMILAWANVSQGVNYQGLLSQILSSININIRGYEDDKNKLLDKLYRTLYGRRYLVLDDLWDTIVWDEVRLAVPDNKNGSRILLTTRISMVAEVVKTTFVHEMKPLGLEHSWELLCYRVFGDEDYKDDITEACPAPLKDTGMRIADNCKGLPLSITVIGGLLSRERLDPDYWKMIEQDTAGFAATGDDSYLEILSLSYNNLPAYLKHGSIP